MSRVATNVLIHDLEVSRVAELMFILMYRSRIKFYKRVFVLTSSFIKVLSWAKPKKAIYEGRKKRTFLLKLVIFIFASFPLSVLGAKPKLFIYIFASFRLLLSAPTLLKPILRAYIFKFPPPPHFTP